MSELRYLGASAAVGELLLIDGGLCDWHLNKDGSLKVRGLLTTRPDAAPKIFQFLKDMAGVDYICGKVPVGLPQNQQYQDAGFHLLETAKNRVGEVVNTWVFTHNEAVLVIPETVLETLDWPGSFVVDHQEYIKSFLGQALSPVNCRYMPRSWAETEERFKQLVVYAVIRCQDKFFLYQRRSGEKRLQAQYSMGVGGHVNPVDGMSGSEVITTALRRELREEIGYELPQGNILRFARALIYHPLTEVGRVHLGICFIIDVPSEASITPNPDDFACPQFCTPHQLIERSSVMENWSACLVEKMFPTHRHATKSR